MELLNFKSNGCRFIYEGILAKYVASGEHDVIEHALIIKSKIKYELSKSIENDTIECTHIIDLEQCYEDKVFKHNLLYSLIIDCMEIDEIHAYELICNLNDLLNKEYFNVDNSGVLIIALSKDKNYIGVFDSSRVKIKSDGDDDALETVKRILGDNITKVSFIKVANINKTKSHIILYRGIDCDDYDVINRFEPFNFHSTKFTKVVQYFEYLENVHKKDPKLSMEEIFEKFIKRIPKV